MRDTKERPVATEKTPESSQHGDELSIVDRLVAEYLELAADGDRPPVEPWLERLQSKKEREEFNELIRFGLSIESCPPSSLKPGGMVGPYRIEAELGAGGMGTVYRAFDTHLERDVALKVLPPHRAGRELLQHRLELESKLLAKLHHPNIVTVHEAGNLQDVRFIVMDVVEGISLDELIEEFQDGQKLPRSGKDLFAALERPIPPGRPALIAPETNIHLAIASIMREIVLGIEAAHSAGILHRDIKPGNIMLDGGLHPVILDFGLAGSAQVPAGNVTERLFGSVPYLAPEQLQQGQVGFDPRTDIYQLGLILYELLVMRRAFPDDSITDALDNIKHGQFVRPRKINTEIPRDLEAICIKAVEHEPSRRYASAKEMGEDLDRFLAGRRTKASTPSLAHDASLFIRRNKRILKVAGLALVLGIVGSYLLLPESKILMPTPNPQMMRWARDSSNTQKMMPGGPQVIKPMAFVRDGDKLFADITLNAAATILALSVVGPKLGEPQFVNPLKPLHIASTPEGLSPLQSENPYSLRLRAGKHRIYFADIEADDAQTNENWYEGLWIFYTGSSSSCEWLVDAMQKVDRELEGNSGTPGLEYSAAELCITGAIKDAGDIIRGGSKPLSAEETKNLKSFFHSRGSGEKDAWLLRDVGVFKVYYQLDR